MFRISIYEIDGAWNLGINITFKKQHHHRSKKIITIWWGYKLIEITKGIRRG